MAATNALGLASAFIAVTVGVQAQENCPVGSSSRGRAGSCLPVIYADTPWGPCQHQCSAGTISEDVEIVNSTASLHFGKAVHRREPVCVFAEDGAPAENCAPQPASTFERVCPSSPRLGLRAPAASAYNHGRPGGAPRPHNTDECGDIAAGGQERSGRCGDDAYFLHMLDSRPSSCIDLSGSWMQYAPSSTRGNLPTARVELSQFPGSDVGIDCSGTYAAASGRVRRTEDASGLATYVIITASSGARDLRLAEVAVYDGSGVPVKPVAVKLSSDTQSTPARNCIDGDKDTICATKPDSKFATTGWGCKGDKDPKLIVEYAADADILNIVITADAKDMTGTTIAYGRKKAVEILNTFNFGSKCSGGEGSFTQFVKMDEAVVVGQIPVEKNEVRVTMKSVQDVDLQLWDLDASPAVPIIGYEDLVTIKNGQSIMSESFAQAQTYKGVEYKWSGFDGVDGEKGNEYINIMGATNQRLEMRAYGYAAGSAEVSYSWEAPENCVEDNQEVVLTESGYDVLWEAQFGGAFSFYTRDTTTTTTETSTTTTTTTTNTTTTSVTTTSTSTTTTITTTTTTTKTTTTTTTTTTPLHPWYVWIRTPKGREIDIAEVEAYHADGTKLKATDVGMSPTHVGWPAVNCIDGRRTSSLYDHGCRSLPSTESTGAWLWVQFEPSSSASSSSIAKIRVTNRLDCCRDQIAGASIAVYEQLNAAKPTWSSLFDGVKPSYTFCSDESRNCVNFELNYFVSESREVRLFGRGINFVNCGGDDGCVGTISEDGCSMVLREGGMLLRENCAIYQEEKRFLQTPCRVYRGMLVSESESPSTFVAPTSGTSSRSDLDCSRQCVEQPVCTAWSFTPAGSRSGRCDMFVQQAVSFSSSTKSGVVSGKRCEAAPLTLTRDGSEYRYYADAKSWDEARASCHQLGAGYELLATKSDAEVAFVKDRVLGGGMTRDVWNGCRNNGENIFTYVDGTPCGAGVPGTSWKPSEPNFSGMDHGCARYDASDERYRWADHLCNYALPYVCKRPARAPTVVQGAEVTFAVSYIEAEDHGLWWSTPSPWTCAHDRLTSNSGNCDVDLSVLNDKVSLTGNSLHADGFRVVCPIFTAPENDDVLYDHDLGSGDTANPTARPSMSPTKSPTYKDAKSRCAADAAVLTKVVGNGAEFKCAEDYDGVRSKDGQQYMHLDRCEESIRFLNAFVLSTTYSSTDRFTVASIPARSRAPGGGQCPPRYPYAFRPSHGFDRCCATTMDGSGTPGKNSGPMDGRASDCGQGGVVPSYVECASPPCSDYFIAPSEVTSAMYNVALYRGDTVKEPLQFAKDSKARVIQVVGAIMEVTPLPASDTLSSFWAPVAAVAYESMQDLGSPTIRSAQCRKGCLPGFHEERHHDHATGLLRSRKHPGADFTSLCKPGVCASVCKRCFGSLSNCTACHTGPFPVLAEDGANGYTCRAATPASLVTVIGDAAVTSESPASNQEENSSDGSDSNGFMVAFVIVLLLLIGVAGLAVAMFVKQRRDKNATQTGDSVKDTGESPTASFEPSYEAEPTPVAVNSLPVDMYIEIQEPEDGKAGTKAGVEQPGASKASVGSTVTDPRGSTANAVYDMATRSADDKFNGDKASEEKAAGDKPKDEKASGDKPSGISRDRAGSVYTGFGGQDNAYYNQTEKAAGGGISRDRQGSVYKGFAAVDDPDADEDDDDEDAPLDF